MRTYVVSASCPSRPTNERAGGGILQVAARAAAAKSAIELRSRAASWVPAGLPWSPELRMDRRSYVVGRARPDHCNVWTESEQVQGDRDIEKAQAQDQAPQEEGSRGPTRYTCLSAHGIRVVSARGLSSPPTKLLSACLSILLFYHVTKSAESTFLFSFLSQTEFRCSN